MEITRHNYEAFAIDFIEGNLSVKERKAFELFLQSNPDLANDFEYLPDFSVEDTDHFPNQDKLALKKASLLSDPISLKNCDYYFTAYHEGDLNQKEREYVVTFLQKKPHKRIDFEQLSVLRFSAEADTVFTNKGKLKQVIPLSFPHLLLRIAAIILFLSSTALFLFLPRNVELNYTQRQAAVQLQSKNNKGEDSSFDKLIETRIKFSDENVIKNEVNYVQTEDSKKKVLEENHLNENNSFEIAVVKKTEIKQEPKDKSVSEEIPILLEAAYASNSSPSETVHTIENVDTENTKEKKDVIMKFNRPRFTKKKTKDDRKTIEEELLASNNNDVLLKISNPFKKLKKKEIKLGSFKIKRKKG
jgi:hypothetical protein